MTLRDIARRKLVAARSLSWRDRGLVAEAALLLCAARLTLWLVPFRRYRTWLSVDRRRRRGRTVSPMLVSRVGRAVRIAARNLPFEAVCLPRAMAAKLMLARRGCPSSLVIGSGSDDGGAMTLHAWLDSGGTIVVGDNGRSSVTPVVRFGSSSPP